MDSQLVKLEHQERRLLLVRAFLEGQQHLQQEAERWSSDQEQVTSDLVNPSPL